MREKGPVHVGDELKVRQIEALERIADALERAYPPKPALRSALVNGAVVSQSPDCTGCASFPTCLCFTCAKYNSWV